MVAQSCTTQHIMGKSKQSNSFYLGTLILLIPALADTWFSLIEHYGWNWVCRIRRGKDLRLATEDSWISVKDFIPQVSNHTKDYPGCVIDTKDACFLLDWPAGKKIIIRSNCFFSCFCRFICNFNCHPSSSFSNVNFLYNILRNIEFK